MLVRFTERLEQYARWWVILVLVGIVILFQVVIMPRALFAHLVGSAGPLDVLPFYMPDRAYAMMETYGEAGRAAYRKAALTVDVLYPIVYTLCLSLLVVWLGQHCPLAQGRLHRASVIPFGALLFDLAENASVAALLSAYPTRLTGLAWLAAACTLLKWSFVGVSLLVVLGVAGCALSSVRGRQQ